MSAFAGLFHFDRQPVDREMLSAMGHAIETKGPDGGDDYLSGALGMTYRAFHTTRESKWESQPMQGSFGEVLCWDGRLDNREELQLQLRCPRLPSDAELAIAAYERWGESFLAHLVGDFALAIFDPRERQVLLGRDFFGPRPLFYLLQAEKLMWSTDLLPLMQHGGVDLALDDEYVAQFLILATEPHRSPYRNIHAVEPGHLTVFREGRVVRNTWYWKPDPTNEIRYANDREYEEQFFALVRQSVKARLRSDGPIWGDLSGGLDSSSIVCMADQIMAQDCVDCPRLDTWTAVNGESILTNELPYVRLVEKKRGRTGHHIHEDELWFKNILEDFYQTLLPNPLLCVPERIGWLNSEMNRAGARVRLSGHGGDHLLGNGGIPAEPADLLRSFHFGRLHDQLRTWSHATKQPYLKILAANALLPLLPHALRQPWESKRNLTDSLPDAFLSRFSPRLFRTYPPDPFGNKLPSRRERVRHMLAAIRTTAAGIHPGFSQFEVRYPYLDRRLVEWLLAIPSFQIQRSGEIRSLMKRAFHNLLPPLIGKRVTKGTIDEAICRQLNVAWKDVEEVLQTGRLARQGYFEKTFMQDAAKSVAHGGSMTRVVFIRLLAIELWLRTLERKRFWPMPLAPRANPRPAATEVRQISFAKE